MERKPPTCCFGSFFANYNIDDLVSYKDALKKGSTGFKALEIDPSNDNGDHITIVKQEKILQSGVIVDSNEQVRDEENNKKNTIEHHFDNRRMRYQNQRSVKTLTKKQER